MITISFLIQFVPVITGFIFLKIILLNYKQSKIILIYSLIGIITELLSKFTNSILTINSMYFIHFYTLIEFILLSYIFYKGIAFENLKKYLVAVSVLYFVVWIMLKIFIEDFNSFDNYSSALSSILLAAVSLVMLSKLMVNNEIKPLKNPTFWFLSSVFVYHFLNIIVFLFYNLQEYEMMWTFHSAVNITSQILMTIYFISLNRLIADENKGIRDLIRESDEIRNRIKYKLALI